MSDELALFPLPAVLFPGAPLPLHVFEPRYRALVADVQAAPRRERYFGVVATARPAGMTTGAQLTDLREVGTTARLLEVDPLPDGRYELSAVGTRRFRLLDLIHDDRPYLVGRVEWIDPPDGLRDPAPNADAIPQLQQAVSAAFDAYLTAVATLQDLTLEDLELPTAADALSWTVAAVTVLTGDERHELLATVGTADRLVAELRVLRRETALVRATRTLPATDGLLNIDHSVS